MVNMSGPDYILDIDGLRQPEQQKPMEKGPIGTPWISVFWKCCGAYSRVYRNPEGTMYVGHCPKCMKRVQAKVGKGGTSKRFFEAE